MRVAVWIVAALFVCVACASPQAFSKEWYSQQRLIQTSADSEPEWMSMKELLALREQGVSFMDVTDPRPNVAVPEPPALPNQPQQKLYVHSLIRQLSMTNMKANVETLSSFHTRFYATETGAKAAEWIHSTVSAIASDRSDISVKFFNSTTTAPQPSVIARIEGSQSTDIVILGSHEDSVHFGPLGRSPGVDDDGSGTVCSLEVFRVLVSSGFKPNRTVEFHFYA